MKTLTSLTVGLLFAGMTITGNVAFAASTSELLQQGLYAEEVEGNVDAAIKAYDQVIRNTSAPPNQVAQALYRQGMCYLKIKDEAAARWKNSSRIIPARPRSSRRPGRCSMN
jgi:hypothetical protein